MFLWVVCIFCVIDILVGLAACILIYWDRQRPDDRNKRGKQ